ncbi:MAG: class II fructose-bisphosphate aldolase [Planctomycetes bacterium]|nr:class II fructose-bisphosphate aldolase [Planctomycetota bacterium]
MTEPSLVTLTDICTVAESRGICVPAFDVGGGNPDFIRSVFDVCREHDSVALFIAWAGSARNFGFSALASLVRSLAAEAGVPAALQLDHGRDDADVRAAIDAGFSAVMFDGSDKPFEENVEQTAKVVALAHQAGVSAEGALGTLGRSGEGEPTDPDEAARFVEATGIDVLTPSVGNRHGCRGFTVPLDWGLIERLSEKVTVPMALHGGSGVAHQDVRKAAGFGFRKVNVATKLHLTYDGAVKAYIRDNPDHGWFRWSSAGRDALKSLITEYVTELNLQGTATELRARP